MHIYIATKYVYCSFFVGRFHHHPWPNQVIDADGSGTLHVTELVQGLLKIRGELTKSDSVDRSGPENAGGKRWNRKRLGQKMTKRLGLGQFSKKPGSMNVWSETMEA